MVDMKHVFKISVHDNCDNEVRLAIERMNSRSAPFSLASKRYSVLRLFREELDDVLANYQAGLELKHRMFEIPGLYGELPFSEHVRKLGPKKVNEQVRYGLKRFMSSALCANDEIDSRFIDTADTLVEVLFFCQHKKPAMSKTDINKMSGTHLNMRRPKELCSFCGELSEFAQYMENKNLPEYADLSDRSYLSHKYCCKHRPLLHDGTWNSEYRKAKRNQESFELEAHRFLCQTASREKAKAASGNEYVDQFILKIVAATDYIILDEDKIRNLARRVIDFKISDRKKQVLVMNALGMSQAEIARQLNVRRQAISKMLKSIPDEFRLIVS